MLESSGSHPTLSHLKENNKSFLPVWNNRPAEGRVRWGILTESMISAWLTDIESLLHGPLFQHTPNNINKYTVITSLYLTNYLTCFAICYLKEMADSFPVFISSTGKIYLYYSLIYRNRTVMVHLLYIASCQIGALHVSPSASLEYHDSCRRCDGRRW